MGTVSDKLTYLNGTKTKLKDVINLTEANITSETTFRNYAKALYDGYINVLKDKGTLLDNMPKGTSTGYITNAADLPVYESKMSKLSTQKNTILPDGYTQVDYIKNTDGQYIDTGLFPLEISSGKFDISWDEISSGTSYFMGGYYTATSGTIYYSPLLVNRQNKAGIGFAEWMYTDYSWNLGDRHKVSFTIISGKQTLSIDGVEVINEKSTLERPETTATVPILAYQYQNRRLSSYGWKGKVYSIKLYGNNNELIRNYIPCYRNSDNEVGLYDVVNNAFYTNQGTGSFTYGSTVSIPNPDYPQEVKTVKGNVGITITDGTNTRNYTIPLGNNEIAGIGDYKDELIVDKNGHCWLNKKIGKVVLDGTENWISSGSQPENGLKIFYINNNINFINNTLCISNLLLPISINEYLNAIKQGVVLNNNVFNVCLLNTNMTLSDWKNLLSNNNMIVYYPVAEPELIDLNYNVDLSLFKGVNNISNSEDMDMEIKYILENYEEGE